ncbi:MAG TPA: hypothetical protein VHM30_19510 [Gemmatimonadaceae bacterium]|nr:hypothetical protein [Gemmatimonadaceae bacterium]
MRASFVLVTALALAAGCGRFRTQPVPLHGEAAAIASLAGRWSGEYEGLDTGRGGTITFVLRAGSDSAVGDVLMEQRGTTTVFRAADVGQSHLAHASSPQLLAVSFAAISPEEVTGKLEPYTAPDCSCTVTTTFRGRITGDTLSGTFTTTAPMLTTQNGRWRMVREKP